MTSKEEFLLANPALLERELDHVEDVIGSLELKNAAAVRGEVISRLERIYRELYSLHYHYQHHLKTETSAALQLVMKYLHKVITDVKAIRPMKYAKLRSGMWEWIRDDILVVFRKFKAQLMKLEPEIVKEMGW